MARLTKPERRLLEWAGRTTILESQVVASDLSRALNALLRQGLVALIDHPTVKEGLSRIVPATAVDITASGRAALSQQGGEDEQG